MIQAKVTLTFTEPLLGSTPKNKDVYSKFIESEKVKRVDAEAAQGAETETITEVDENRGWTGFHSDEHGIFIYDYAIKGFLKEASNILKESIGVKALRSKLDNYLFVFPRRVHIQRGGQNILNPEGVLERPLRAQTMQGPRVTLAKSDLVKEGATLEFEVKILETEQLKQAEEILEQCLQYGALKGLGQFRNGSYGRFSYKIKFEKPQATE